MSTADSERISKELLGKLGVLKHAIAHVEEALNEVAETRKVEWTRIRSAKRTWRGEELASPPVRWLMSTEGEGPWHVEWLPEGSWYAVELHMVSRQIIVFHSNRQAGAGLRFHGWFLQNASIYEFEALAYGTAWLNWTLGRALELVIDNYEPNYFCKT